MVDETTRINRLGVILGGFLLPIVFKGLSYEKHTEPSRR